MPAARGGRGGAGKGAGRNALTELRQSPCTMHFCIMLCSDHYTPSFPRMRESRNFRFRVPRDLSDVWPQRHIPYLNMHNLTAIAKDCPRFRHHYLSLQSSHMNRSRRFSGYGDISPFLTVGTQYDKKGQAKTHLSSPTQKSILTEGARPWNK